MSVRISGGWLGVECHLLAPATAGTAVCCLTAACPTTDPLTPPPVLPPHNFPSQMAEELRPFFCLDLSYAHTLLTRGFKIPEDAQITLVKRVEYNGDLIEAAWPLGAAINVLG